MTRNTVNPREAGRMSTSLAKFHERGEKGRRAKAEVLRRLELAVDRLDVALQSDPPSSSTIAQGLHGIHYLQRGYADGNSQRDIPEDAPDFQLDERRAEELALGLLDLLAGARRARSTWGEQE